MVPSKVLLTQSEELRVQWFKPVLLFASEVPFPHGNSHVGASLEDFYLAGDWAPFLNHLYARRACPNHSASFASDVGATGRPESDVLDCPFELLDTLVAGDVPL